MVLPCEGSSLVKIKKKSKKYKNAQYCLLGMKTAERSNGTLSNFRSTDGKPLPVGDLDKLEHNIQVRTSSFWSGQCLSH